AKEVDGRGSVPERHRFDSARRVENRAEAEEEVQDRQRRGNDVNAAAEVWAYRLHCKQIGSREQTTLRCSLPRARKTARELYVLLTRQRDSFRTNESVPPSGPSGGASVFSTSSLRTLRRS